MTDEQLAEWRRLADDADSLSHEPWRARDGLKELAAEVERLRAALRPFADAASEFDASPYPAIPWSNGTPADSGVTVGDLRRAREVLGDG